MRSFTREQQANQVYYCLRRCEGKEREDGTWNHEACHHVKRWLENRREVDSLPAGLLAEIQKAYDSLTMAQDVARFSGGPASSSASYGPSSKQEDSAPSGQAETSDEQGGTS